MTTTINPASGFSLPHLSRRAAMYAVAIVVLIAAVLSVVLTQVVGSSGGSHPTHQGVFHIQQLGVAGQNNPEQCLHGPTQRPRAC